MKPIFKATLIAALVLGAVSAQAAQNATLNITGKIVKSSCDVTIGDNNLDLGTWIPSDFTMGTPLAASTKSATVAFANCTGQDLAIGDSLIMLVEPVTQDSALTASGLWGEGAVENVGIELKATTGVVPVAQTLTPLANEIAIYTAGGTIQPVAGLTITPAKLTASLKNTAPITTYGKVKSSVIVSAFYE